MAAKRPWLRLYRDAIKSPKIGRLTLEGMGFWAALLMLSEDDGTLPSKEDVSWHLRLTPEETEKHLSEMVRHGLVTRDVTDPSRVTYRLHDWDEHQCISDADMTARDRKKRQREREKAQKSAVTRDVTDMSRVTSRTGHGDVTRTESESESEKRRIPPTPQTQKPGPKPGGGDGMFDGFCLAMNLTPNEMLRLGSTWSMAKAEYATWIEAGAIPELDIWPTVKAVTEKYRDNNPGMKVPNTPRYFTQAILRAVEVRKAAMPETASSVVVGPNGKVLNDHGKPWRLPPKDAIWFPQFRWWFTRKQVELSIIDATQHGNICPLLYDMELKPQPWLPEWARILIQEAGEPRKPDTWGVYSDRLGKWPVRSPNELQRVLKDYFEALSNHATIIPADWKPEVAA